MIESEPDHIGRQGGKGGEKGAGLPIGDTDSGGDAAGGECRNYEFFLDTGR